MVGDVSVEVTGDHEGKKAREVVFARAPGPQNPFLDLDVADNAQINDISRKVSKQFQRVGLAVENVDYDVSVEQARQRSKSTRSVRSEPRSALILFFHAAPSMSDQTPKSDLTSAWRSAISCGENATPSAGVAIDRDSGEMFTRRPSSSSIGVDSSEVKTSSTTRSSCSIFRTGTGSGFIFRSTTTSLQSGT